MSPWAEWLGRCLQSRFMSVRIRQETLRKASVGDNKSLVRCSLFAEGEASYLVITSKKLVFNREHFSNLYKNK